MSELQCDVIRELGQLFLQLLRLCSRQSAVRRRCALRGSSSGVDPVRFSLPMPAVTRQELTRVHIDSMGTAQPVGPEHNYISSCDSYECIALIIVSIEILKNNIYVK